jgi:hypothetical protein
MYLSRSESALDSLALSIGHQSMAAQATCLTKTRARTHTPVNIFVSFVFIILFSRKRSFLRSSVIKVFLILAQLPNLIVITFDRAKSR